MNGNKNQQYTEIGETEEMKKGGETIGAEALLIEGSLSEQERQLQTKEMESPNAVL